MVTGPRVPEPGWGGASGAGTRPPEGKGPAFPAVLTDCVNSVMNAMGKQEECLSLKKKKAFGVACFYFN